MDSSPHETAQEPIAGAHRLTEHPILDIPTPATPIGFQWQDRELVAMPGEVISSALIAAGVSVFGHHPRDGSPLGLFCANGQCGSCTVIADGIAVKACMTPVRQGMRVVPADESPPLPLDVATPEPAPTEIKRVEALVIGAGPAGLAAAAELAEAGIGTLLIDDKATPGGKLVVQTHRFFGSVEDTSAGRRGFDIAAEMTDRLSQYPQVEVWTEATAVGVFADRRIGVVRRGGYWLIEPDTVLVATGARERQIPFPGHTLPGVVGAGAFQTLLNRDGVVPCRRLLLVGGGNVGLIAAYHALQAGIEVVALVELMPEVGGYRVHADKLRRLGVPVHLSHTIVAAHGIDRVEAATVAAVDDRGEPIPSTTRTFAVDAVLVAAGLAPLDELAIEARECGLDVWTAGDAAVVSEASAAAVGGRIAARRMAAGLGRDVEPVPPEWENLLRTLEARPGPVVDRTPAHGPDLFPVLRCTQEIACNPCVDACRQKAIEMDGDPIRGLPRFNGEGCTGCAKCVAVCPGLAITLVDRRADPARPLVTVPFELDAGHVTPGSSVLATDGDGVPLGRFEVVDVKDRRRLDHTLLVRIRATAETAPLIAGIRVQDPADLVPVDPVPVGETPDDVIVCRCEHVTAGEIRAAVRSGIRDINELKSTLRVCMGACCGKNCPEHIAKIYRDEGIPASAVTAPTHRPLFVEVPIGVFARGSREEAR
ncbi:MAG TPA: FAD-dependent oxidoreductase [Acidimicrobiia bacterium]|nr:FAD-dependent oxidoreductase [Acidimicrobiia bacterium]